MNTPTAVLPRVFFAFQMERYNLKAAEKYGQVVYAINSKNTPSPFEGSLLPEALDRGMRKLEFNPTSDWIALCGPLFHIAAMTSIVSARGAKYIKFLIFDAKAERYVERRVMFSDINIHREQDISKTELNANKTILQNS